MSYRVQFTPIIPKYKLTGGLVQAQLHSMLSRDLAEEAEKVIAKMQEYPGESKKSIQRYRRTGQLVLRTRGGFRVSFGSKGQPIRELVDPERGQYIRTGLLGQSWTYNINDSVGGGLTLVFNNTAHDRPGNYYAGWVNGFIKADAKGRYHQASWHKAAGWANFSDELNKTKIAEKAQKSIDDFLKELGLM